MPDPMKLALSSAYGNVVALPVAPTHRWVQLVNLNGVEFARAGFPTADRDPGAPWDWIRETVANELSVRPDMIGCLEPDNDEDDGGDYVTVDGLPVYRVNILRNLC